jgi:hypothetical protein
MKFKMRGQHPDQMFKHVERLIGQRRRELQHQRRERRVPTQRLELRQMLDAASAAKI